MAVVVQTSQPFVALFQFVYLKLENRESMNIEELREYCVSKPGVTEEFPFDEVTLVFKVRSKMFALTNLDGDWTLALKCDPDRATELREQYPAIQPGYHMSKVHWNTVMMDGSLSSKLILELIDHSYQLVVNKLPLKIRQELGFLKSE
jgi:predicted DNA-binding protein (MmcQ/YjbR family)